MTDHTVGDALEPLDEDSLHKPGNILGLGLGWGWGRGGMRWGWVGWDGMGWGERRWTT